MQLEVDSMTIAVRAVYEGNGVLKLERPVALKDKAKVRVVIEAEAESAAQATGDDDPTGWKTADELIGFMKDGPKGPIGEQHDEYLYRK
jgi:predicted DNA-binding antitoxin AbrB/MazE fold protein